MSEWKDATSYQRGDRERKPTTFEICDGPLRLVVLSGHIHYPGKWVFHCFDLGFDTHLLAEAKTVDEAKRLAIHLVSERLQDMIAALTRISLHTPSP
jgi:hypothetical protein